MKKDIYEIVIKSIKGRQFDIKESIMLDSFLSEVGNHKVYESLKKVYDNSKGVENMPQMDVDRAFDKYLKLSGGKKSNNRKLWVFSIMKYASVFTLMVAISFALYYAVTTTFDSGKQNEVVADIAPGSHKAELVLASGEVVKLQETPEDIKVKDGTEIKNTGEELIYDSSVEKEDVKLSYNSLVVPRGGEYSLRLADGTKVRINSESKLSYPTQFGSDKRVVLLEGEAYFDVTKDKKRPFIVKTNGIDVKVLGTSFNVCSYGEEREIQTTLVEGRVEVSDSKGRSGKIVLEPGYQARFIKKDGILRSEKVDVKLYTSWKDERFVFEDIRLEDLLMRLARWYDVEVFYMNEDVRNLTFSGGVRRYEKLDKLLHMFEKTRYVKFEMKGRTLIVKKKYKK